MLETDQRVRRCSPSDLSIRHIKDKKERRSIKEYKEYRDTDSKQENRYLKKFSDEIERSDMA